MIACAPTLRHALQLASQFHPLALEHAHIELTERLGVARVRVSFIQARTAADRTIIELIMALVIRMLRMYGCTSSDMHAVCFEHARPAHHHAYTKAFAGAERFTGVEFAARALDRPHIHRHPELQMLARAQAERALERLSRPSTFVERVSIVMRRQPNLQDLDMKVVARELGVSVRSLRRRLRDEQTSYRALTRALIEQSAASLLRNPDLTLQTIADKLGFAHVTVFHRAFKRWTRLTPSEFRASATRASTRAWDHAGH